MADRASIPDWVSTFVAEHRILSLATVGPGGEPHVADLYYAPFSGLNLDFVSTGQSLHIRNIARDSRVALTIHADSQRWRDIVGIQMQAHCSALKGVESATAWAGYTARFPFILTDPVLLSAAAKVKMYRITPYWLRWIDNTVTLGHNEEYNF